MSTQKFRITNLTCEACVKLSTMALGDLPGVVNVSVDLKSGVVTLDSENEIDWSEIVAALKAVGKDATQD